MAEMRQQVEDQRVASLLAMTANVNRDPKKRSKPYQPSDFMPQPVEKTKPPPGHISALKAAFIGK